MRIALNGRFYGAALTGVQRFAREVSLRLAARGEVVLLLPAGVDPPQDVPFAGVVRGRLRGHAWEQTELPWRVRGAGCDVCLSPGGTLPGRGGPHVGVVHDVLPLTHPHWFARPFSAWYRIAVGRNARRAARIVTVSEWSAQQIAATLGITRDRIVVAPQGVAPFELPASREAVARVRAALRLPSRFVLAIGPGDPRKNLGFLAEVLRVWRERDNNAPELVLVGRREARVFGARTAETASPHVRSLGRVDDATLHALYTSAAVLAFPSWEEGYGRPPLEALACGTPAVATPYGAAAEVLRDAVPLVPLDVGLWIDHLAALAEAGRERDATVARGRAWALRGSWERAADTVLDACAAASAQPAGV